MRSSTVNARSIRAVDGSGDRSTSRNRRSARGHQASARSSRSARFAVQPERQVQGCVIATSVRVDLCVGRRERSIEGGARPSAAAVPRTATGPPARHRAQCGPGSSAPISPSTACTVWAAVSIAASSRTSSGRWVSKASTSVASRAPRSSRRRRRADRRGVVSVRRWRRRRSSMRLAASHRALSSRHGFASTTRAVTVGSSTTTWSVLSAPLTRTRTANIAWS